MRRAPGQGAYGPVLELPAGFWNRNLSSRQLSEADRGMETHRLRPFHGCFRLEHVPKELIVDLVVELNLRRLDDRAELSSASVGRGPLQVGVPPLHVGA